MFSSANPWFTLSISNIEHIPMSENTLFPTLSFLTVKFYISKFAIIEIPSSPKGFDSN